MSALLCVLAQTSGSRQRHSTLEPPASSCVYAVSVLGYCCTLSELKGDHLVGVVSVPSGVASLGTASHTAIEPEEPMATHSASSA